MKLAMTFTSVLFVSMGALAVEKTTVKTTTNVTTTMSAPAVTPVVTSGTLAQNTLAFNFVGLSQGKTNIYLDVGGLSERVTPALSFRSYSNKEKRKKLQDTEMTVDRSLATVGASVLVFKRDNKSVVVNPYLFFGTEKDAINTATANGFGTRLLGQVNASKGIAIQAGVDANNMEETFKSDIYVGLAFAL